MAYTHTCPGAACEAEGGRGVRRVSEGVEWQEIPLEIRLGTAELALFGSGGLLPRVTWEALFRAGSKFEVSAWSVCACAYGCVCVWVRVCVCRCGGGHD